MSRKVIAKFSHQHTIKRSSITRMN